MEKGRAGDALSTAQRQVVARMNKKVKDLKAKQKAGLDGEVDPDADYVRTADRWKTETGKKSGFKSKRKSKFTPRVRYIEDEMLEDEPLPPPVNPAPPRLAVVTDFVKATKDIGEAKRQPYIPEYVKPDEPVPKKTGAKRPFLRIVT